jgi:hypothetical protein
MIAAVDRTASRIYAGPCHALVEGAGEFTRGGRCQRDLYAKPGADEFVCDGHRADNEGCGASHTATERRSWLVAEIREHIFTLRELWEASGTLLGVFVAWETVRKWPRAQRNAQPRLLPVGDLRGEPLYRGSDVFDLIRDETTRPGRRRAS